ncbi:MAG: hypothetical protein ACLRSW_07425 [Christensenellaceae bacterium]
MDETVENYGMRKRGLTQKSWRRFSALRTKPSAVENGYGFRRLLLLKIAAAFDVTVDELLTADVRIPPSPKRLLPRRPRGKRRARMKSENSRRNR